MPFSTSNLVIRAWVRSASAAAVVAVTVLVVAVLGPVATASAASDPSVAPGGTLSPDGRTVTAGSLRLSANQVSGLDPAGQSVQVSGSGYDATKGV